MEQEAAESTIPGLGDAADVDSVTLCLTDAADVDTITLDLNEGDMEVTDEVLGDDIEATEQQTTEENAATQNVEDEDKGTKPKSSWVDIIEKERDGKLHGELTKIGKLISMSQKGKEIRLLAEKRRLRVFPLYPQDIGDDYIAGLLNKCPQANVRFFSVKNTDGTIVVKGMLELTFAREGDVEEHKAQLSDIREDIQVFHGAEKEEEYKAEWHKVSETPSQSEAINKLTLFAPSLPESVTEDELWELFPRAREVWLVPGSPRQHAFVKFGNEESLQLTIDELKAQGPPREDFNFCRLVRYYDVARVVQMYKDEEMKTNRRGRVDRRSTGATSNYRRPGQRTSGSQQNKKPDTNAQDKSASKTDKGGPSQASSDKGNQNNRQPPAQNKRVNNRARANARANRRNQAADNNNSPRYGDRGRRNDRQSGGRQRRDSPLRLRRPPLDRSMNQLQRSQPAAAPMMGQDNRQGLQVLGSLLSTLGQLSDSSAANPVQSLSTMLARAQGGNSPAKRIHSPGAGYDGDMGGKRRRPRNRGNSGRDQDYYQGNNRQDDRSGWDSSRGGGRDRGLGDTGYRNVMDSDSRIRPMGGSGSMQSGNDYAVLMNQLGGRDGNTRGGYRQDY